LPWCGKKRIKFAWEYPEGISGLHEVNLIFVLDREGRLIRVQDVESTNSKLESNLILAVKKASFPFSRRASDILRARRSTLNLPSTLPLAGDA